MSDHIIPIEKQDFFPNVVRKKMDGWRFAQMCAVRTEDGYELSYTFVNGPDMDTLRLELEKEEPIVSIYTDPEMQGSRVQVFVKRPAVPEQYNNLVYGEMLGVRIKGITMDYKHKLYRIDTETPFAQKGVK